MKEAAPPPEQFVTQRSGQRTVFLRGEFKKRADGTYLLRWGAQQFAAMAAGKYTAVVEYRGGQSQWFDRGTKKWGTNKDTLKGSFRSNVAPIYLE